MAPTPLRSTNAIAVRIRGRSARRLSKPNVRHVEAAYISNLRALVVDFNRIVYQKLIEVLDYVEKPIAPRFDAPSDIIDRTFNGLRVVMETFFDKRKLQRLTSDAALAVDANNRRQFRHMIKTVLRVDPLLSEPWLLESVDGFVKENISLIKSIPSENLADIEQMLYRDSQRHLSPQEMRKNIQEKFGVAESRAELIATDQVLKFNGALTELRQRGVGVKRYTWRTSEDERVRPLHRQLDGNVYAWDKPPVSGTNGERLPPGMPIRCRCYAEPLLDELLR